ncbi:hypothetical protein [Paenibacillus thermotolerans]|uniref:hypothetical protein n=1 Tax=Paenibacillus thermotolerans TaxID=3027807 RepID=UPI0023688171|nr:MULTISPECIES: hypothetical protein [unclassified Paenibacillus]
MLLRIVLHDSKQVELKWFHYNCDKNFKEYNESGTYAADSVIHSAWQYRDESLGFFFANITDEPETIAVELDLKKYGLPDRGYSVRRIAVGRSNEELFEMKSSEAKRLNLSIPGKSVVIVEVL